MQLFLLFLLSLGSIRQSQLLPFISEFSPYAIFGLNAIGLRSNVRRIALSRSCLFSLLFSQFTQLQPWQNTLLAKHSQYNLRHWDFLQLQQMRRLWIEFGVASSFSWERGFLILFLVFSCDTKLGFIILSETGNKLFIKGPMIITGQNNDY